MKKRSILYGAIIIVISIISFFAGSKWAGNTKKQVITEVPVIQYDQLSAKIKQTGKFSESLLYDIKGYKNVAVNKVDSGFIIGGEETPVGLYLRYMLNRDKRYSVKITGKGLSGITTMRVRRNNGKPEYLRAPNGSTDMLVYDTKELELLFYSDNRFSYELSSIVIDSCPASMSKCKCDDDLRNLILKEVPELDIWLVEDRFKAAVELLNWVANNIDLAISKEIHDMTMVNFSSKQASEIYYQIFLPDKGGVWCGGSAVFFNKVARLFDYDSFTINFGDTRDDLTHVACIIAFPYRESWRYYIFDPTFNFTFRLRSTKAYASVSDLINKIRSKKYSEIYLDEMGLNKREYIAIKKDMSKCKQLKYENEAYLVCSSNNGIRPYFGRHRRQLIMNGYSAGLPEAYLQLFYNRIFSIGSSNKPEISQIFEQNMANSGIPVGMP